MTTDEPLPRALEIPWRARAPAPRPRRRGAGGPPLGPGQLAWLDAGLAALCDTQLTERDKLAAVMAVLHYVRGAAALDIEAAVQGPDYPVLLRRLLDGERFPALAAVLEAGVFDDADNDNLAEFHSGLGQLLDGIATKVLPNPR